MTYTLSSYDMGSFNQDFNHNCLNPSRTNLPQPLSFASFKCTVQRTNGNRAEQNFVNTENRGEQL